MAQAKKRAVAKKKGVSASAVAAGVIAAGAAAAAGYYFYGAKNAKQHRKEVSSWAKDFQKDVIREAKKLKVINEAVLHEMVDRIATSYRGGKGIDAAELKAIVHELKSNWKKIQADARAASKRVAKTTKKAVKKTARKARR